MAAPTGFFSRAARSDEMVLVIDGRELLQRIVFPSDIQILMLSCLYKQYPFP